MTGRRWDTYRRPVMVDTLAEVDAVGEGTVMVTGELAPRRCDVAPLVADGWTVAYASAPRAERGGVKVRWLAPWTGGTMPAADAGLFWQHLEYACARFGGGVPVGSPSLTGRDLWARTVPKPPPAPCGEVQDLLRATSSQGRVELFGGQGEVELAEYDQRLAYFAVARALPFGDPADLNGRTARAWIDRNGYGRFRALVKWDAPRGWDRPGILRAEGGGWPTSGRGWCDGAELRLAELHGWRVGVERALCWETHGDPLRTWLDRIMVNMRTAPRGIDAEAWRRTWRNIGLHAIGGFHGSSGQVVTFGADGRTVRPSSGVGLDSHPEWTATIWARARLRLLDAPAGVGFRERVGGLHLPTGRVVGFQNDAVYTAGATDWPSDDGRIGRLRFKRSAKCDRWPTSINDVRRAFRTAN